MGGNPHIGASIIPTSIVEFNSDHITIENRVVSKFWVDLNEMEENASGTGEEIVRTKRKPGDNEGLYNVRMKAVSSTTSL